MCLKLEVIALQSSRNRKINFMQYIRLMLGKSFYCFETSQERPKKKKIQLRTIASISRQLEAISYVFFGVLQQTKIFLYR